MKSALDKHLDTTKFSHICEVEKAFELCENFDDVQKVLGEIPHKFGEFYVELLDDAGNVYDPESEEAEENASIITGFRVTNTYTEWDTEQEDTIDYEWYEG